ncbi:hypothetical protein F25303_11760 [Fusarium sp. NRRL 25303]|nr:hypothetical protein F25303_11760 [Fusarium sp. NRRL 25303]
MSDNYAPNEHTAWDRASGSGQGNIGPDRNRATNDSTPTLAERYDRIAEAKRRQIKAMAYASLNKPCQSRAIRAQGGLESRVVEVPKVVEVLCAECGSTCHMLKGCITTTGMRGCVFCNSTSHATDSCRKFSRLSMGQKVELLVIDRASKPPILTDDPWWVWLHRFLTAPHTKDKPIPESFPWTMEFAREVYDGNKQKSIKEYQHELDHSCMVNTLPTDARLQTMKDVFTLFWDFWDREGRAWPARLDSPPASTGDNASSQRATNPGAPTMEEMQRPGEIIIGQATEIHDWKKKYELLKRENEELKRRLA